MIGLDNIRDLLNNSFFGNGFASYLVSEVYDKIPLFISNITENISAISPFAFLGIASLSFISSYYAVSEGVTTSKRTLLKLASDSRVDQEMIDSLRAKIPKKFENIFVIHDQKLSVEKINALIPELFNNCSLNEPHFCISTLTKSLKEFNHYTAFHDYPEMELKQRLLEYGWNFNVVNQAFTVMDMELCNEISGAHYINSNADIAKLMKVMKELAVKGYTETKIKKYLVENGLKQSTTKKVLRNIYKVQNLHNKTKKVHETKIRRALRLNMAHPSVFSDGNYNS